MDVCFLAGYLAIAGDDAVVVALCPKRGDEDGRDGRGSGGRHTAANRGINRDGRHTAGNRADDLVCISMSEAG